MREVFYLFLSFLILHQSYYRSVCGQEDDVKLYDDNYCDYTDGRDELHSSACSHITAATVRFTCADFTPRAYTIPTSRVNDGVCDCCDGSDEYDTDPWIPLCPITCGFPVTESLKSNMKMTAKLEARRKYPILLVSSSASSISWTRIAGNIHRHNTRNSITVGNITSSSSRGYLRQRSSVGSLPGIASFNGSFRFPSIKSFSEASSRVKNAFSSFNITGKNSIMFADWSNNTVNGEWVTAQIANHTSSLAKVTHSHMKAAHQAANDWITWARTDVYSATMFCCMVASIAIICYFFGQCILRPYFLRHQKQGLMSMYSSRAHMIIGQSSGNKLRKSSSDDHDSKEVVCSTAGSKGINCLQRFVAFICSYCCWCCCCGRCCRSIWCGFCSRWRKQIGSESGTRGAFPLSSKGSMDPNDALQFVEGGSPVRTATAISRDNHAALTHRQNAAGYNAV